MADMVNALEVFFINDMRYINPRFTLLYFTLPLLLYAYDRSLTGTSIAQSHKHETSVGLLYIVQRITVVVTTQQPNGSEGCRTQEAQLSPRDRAMRRVN